MKNQVEKQDTLQDTVTWAINSPACKLAAGMVALYVVGETMGLSTGTMLAVGAVGAGAYGAYKAADALLLFAFVTAVGAGLTQAVVDKGLQRKPRY